MRISVLNDPTFDATQLKRLQRLGTLAVHVDTVGEAEAVRRLQGAGVAVIDGFKVPVTRAVLESSESLRLLVLTSTAFHMVDFAAAGERGVLVANIPAYSTEAVAEHTFALLLGVARAIPQADRAMRDGPFQIDPAQEPHRRFLGLELQGRTLGVVGLGAIGRRVAVLGLGFGMRVVAFNRSPRRMARVRLLPLDELLALADVVTLHLAVHPDTENMISNRELDLMKPGAVLINAAGGELVDTAALCHALKSGKIAGAGLDVLATWDRSNPLLELGNVVLSPQAAAWTREACAALADSIVDTIEAYARGAPINIVNP